MHAAPSTRSTVHRLAKRADYDPAVIRSILDAGWVAHAAFDFDGHPFVIPMVYARHGDALMLHGAVASRFLKTAAGLPMSVCVTIVDGLVYAKSAFHHSMNYRSVVVLGTAREVTEPSEKRAFLDALVERVSPGRAKNVRPPNEKELAATRVLAMPIDEASAKIRTGGPIDDEEDLALPVWAGHVPIAMRAADPISVEVDHHRSVIAAPEIPQDLRAPDLRR